MDPLLPPQMPTISPRRDIRRCFTEARRLSAGTHGVSRRVIVIAPDGALVHVPVPSPEEADQSLLRDVRAALAPGHEPVTGLAITAINATGGIPRRASFHKLLAIMPNLSYLVGAAALGNTVVAFEGHPRDFAVGCQDADMLILDDGMLPLLQPDWGAVALQLLRQPRVILFGRDGRLSRLDRVEMKESDGGTGS